MRIQQISITNLFGLFNHVLPLSKEERITIIHGPNGFGKTILLKMIDGLFSQNYSIFKKIPFKEFRIDFVNGQYLLVTQHKIQNEKLRLSIQTNEGDEKPYHVETISRKDIHFPLGIIDSAISELRRIGAEEWLELPTNQLLSLEDVLEKYGDVLPGDIEYRQGPKWLREIQKGLNTHFVETNRLLGKYPASRRTSRRYELYEREKLSAVVSTVTQYSQELAGKIQDTLAKSAELSQSLDRTFPIRLVKQINQGRKARISSDKLRILLGELEAKRERLMEAGLMGKDDANVQIPDQTVMDDLARIALSIYAKDVEKKLEVFDEMLEKIGLLQQIINARYSYSYKRLTINRSSGFVFETKDNTPLPADALSSGEQHELILFYELLFRVQPNSFILIDEPELSLHIAWQQEFLKDLMAISKLANIDVLIATHSADIIFNRWDLTIELRGSGE